MTCIEMACMGQHCRPLCTNKKATTAPIFYNNTSIVAQIFPSKPHCCPFLRMLHTLLPFHPIGRYT